MQDDLVPGKAGKQAWYLDPLGIYGAWVYKADVNLRFEFTWLSPDAGFMNDSLAPATMGRPCDWV